ncbi:MAG TPA: glycerophosphodiester phosphodiesterase, partial [Candidatus Hydrogenedentes bacterium]|nr:glycerophosphodiester phosphodiesterase [Candidatus Hydrogenedentota bacterium]
QSTGRDVGIYPELKDPSWHRAQGLPTEEAMLAVLRQYGYVGPQARVFIQCFEPATLRRIREELKSDLPLIQLIADSQKNSLATEAGLDAVAQYANGIGPDKRIVEANPAVVQWAHARGLKVHPYTLRKDTVPRKYDSFDAELRQYYLEYDVDGVFVDHPDAAARFLDVWRAAR